MFISKRILNVIKLNNNNYNEQIQILVFDYCGIVIFSLTFLIVHHYIFDFYLFVKISSPFKFIFNEKELTCHFNF